MPGRRPRVVNEAGKRRGFDYGAANLVEPFLFKTKSLLPIAVVTLLALELAACGRRGPLEPPPDTPQGQALARQRANANARRGLGPNGGPALSKADQAKADADQAEVNAINRQSDVLSQDSVPQRYKEDSATPIGDTPLAFPTGTDLVKPPDSPATTTAKNDSSMFSPKGSGRKPPPVVAPDKPFFLDFLLK